MTREGQLDAQQFLRCARFQTDRALGKLLFAKADLRGEPAAAKPAHAEASGALVAAGVDQEAVHTVLERILRSKFQRHVDANERHPAADPTTQQARLGRLPVAAVKDRDTMNVPQAGEHTRHVEKLRRDMPPGDQPGPVEVSDRGLRLVPASHLKEASEVRIVEALVSIDNETIGELAQVVDQGVIELGAARPPENDRKGGN